MNKKSTKTLLLLGLSSLTVPALALSYNPKPKNASLASSANKSATNVKKWTNYKLGANDWTNVYNLSENYGATIWKQINPSEAIKSGNANSVFGKIVEPMVSVIPLTQENQNLEQQWAVVFNTRGFKNEREDDLQGRNGNISNSNFLDKFPSKEVFYSVLLSKDLEIITGKSKENPLEIQFYRPWEYSEAKRNTTFQSQYENKNNFLINPKDYYKGYKIQTLDLNQPNNPTDKISDPENTKYDETYGDYNFKGRLVTLKEWQDELTNQNIYSAKLSKFSSNQKIQEEQNKNFEPLNGIIWWKKYRNVDDYFIRDSGTWMQLKYVPKAFRAKRTVFTFWTRRKPEKFFKDLREDDTSTYLSAINSKLAQRSTFVLGRYNYKEANNKSYSVSNAYVTKDSFIDSDNDKLTDYIEKMLGTNPNDRDTDKDGNADGDEFKTKDASSRPDTRMILNNGSTGNVRKFNASDPRISNKINSNIKFVKLSNSLVIGQTNPYTTVDFGWKARNGSFNYFGTTIADENGFFAIPIGKKLEVDSSGAMLNKYNNNIIFDNVEKRVPKWTNLITNHGDLTDQNNFNNAVQSAINDGSNFVVRYWSDGNDENALYETPAEQKAILVKANELLTTDVVNNEINRIGFSKVGVENLANLTNDNKLKIINELKTKSAVLKSYVENLDNDLTIINSSNPSNNATVKIRFKDNSIGEFNADVFAFIDRNLYVQKLEKSKNEYISKLRSQITDSTQEEINNGVIDLENKFNAAKLVILNKSYPITQLDNKIVEYENEAKQVLENAKQYKKNVRSQLLNEIDSKIASLSNANSSLTNEERQSYSAELNNYKNEINEDYFNNSSSKADVDSLANSTRNKFNKITNESKYKSDAAAKIEQIIIDTDIVNKINNHNLTTEEKQDTLTKLRLEKSKTIANINSAHHNRDIDAYVSTFNDFVSALKLTSSKRENAIARIDQLKVQRKNIIDNSNLTTEEKTELWNTESIWFDEFKNKINDKSRVEKDSQIDSLISEASKKINSPLDSAKRKDAISKVQIAATNRIASINDSYLTNDEKPALINQINTILNETINRIKDFNKHKTNDSIDTIVNDAIHVMQTTPASLESPFKNSIISELERIIQSKKDDINNSPAIIDVEKQVKIAEIESLFEEFKNKINKKNLSNDNVLNEKNSFTDTITSIDMTGTAKNSANLNIDNLANAKKAKIQNSKLTTEEKNLANNKVDEGIANAKAEIAKNQTNSQDAINTIIDNFKIKINDDNISLVSEKKAQAIQSLETMAQSRKQEINNSYLSTNDEKADATDQIDNILSQSINQINDAISNTDVDTLVAEKLHLINGIEAVQNDKINAKNAIKQSYEAKQKAINDVNSQLTDEEKTAKLDEIKQIYEEANNKIDVQSIDRSSVSDVQNNAIQNINNVSLDSLNKKSAIETLNNELEAFKSKITNSNNLTSADKTEAINNASQIINEAIKNIKNSRSNSDVDNFKNNASRDLSNIDVNKSNTITNAIAEIKTVAEQKNQVIDSSNLTEDEKIVAKNQVQELKQTAIDNITNLRSDDKIAQAKINAINNINAVSINSQAKAEAVQFIKNKAQAKIIEIESSPLTVEEKTTEKAEVENSKQIAISSINSANKNSEINNAKEKFSLSLNNVHLTSTIKDKKTAEIEQKASDWIKEYKQNHSYLIEEEIATAITKCNNAKQTAINSVNSANTNQEVLNVYDTFENVLSTITSPSSSAAKQAAKESINQEINKKLQEIDGSSATIEEKNSTKVLLESAKNRINAQIDGAKNQTELDQIVTKGKEAIEAVRVSSITKTNAKTQINDAVTAKKHDISDKTKSTLTKNERKTTSDILDQNKIDAFSAIETAVTDADVEKVKNEWLSKINNISLVSKERAQAISDLNDAANAYKTRISQSNLTAEEKTNANTLVDQLVSQAKEALDQEDDDCNAVKDTFVAKFNDISIESSARKQAIEHVKKQTENKISDLQITNLTSEEKADAIAQINNIKDSAITNINNKDETTDNQSVENAVSQFNSSLNNINTKSVIKSNAIEEIKTAKNNKIVELNAITSLLTTEEIQKFTNLLENILTDASNNINGDQNNSEVQTTKAEYLTKIAEINATVSNDRNEAANELEKLASNKISTLDNISPSLLNSEKADITSQIQKLLSDAKNKVNDKKQTPSKNDLINTINDLKTALNGLNTHSALKITAKSEIDQAVQQKLSEIRNSNLLTTEKTALEAKLEQVKQDAYNAIDSETDENQLANTISNHKEKILAINVVSAKKQASVQDIELYVQAKQAEIDSSNKLTNEEKEEAKTKLDDIKESIINNINSSSVNEKSDLNDIVLKGKEKLDEVASQAQNAVSIKDKAIEELNQLIESKRQEVANATPKLTDEEKAQIEANLNNINSKVSTDINNANSKNDVENVKANLANEIKAILTNSAVKQQAIADIEQKAKEKIETIIQSTKLTVEEKQAKKDEVNTLKKSAIDNIKNATKTSDAGTNSGVAELKNKFISDIDAISDESIAKQNAIDNINQLVNDKINRINSSSTLLDDEKAEAVNQANTLKDQLLNEISVCTTNAEINNVIQKANNELKKIAENSLTIANLVNEIRKSADEKIDRVKNSNLTTEEIAEKINALNLIKDNAQYQIESDKSSKANAETNKQNIINKIEAISLTSDKKQSAVHEINLLVDQKLKEIQTKGLAFTNDESQNLINNIINSKNQAISNINQLGLNNNQVDDLKSGVISAINALQIVPIIKPNAKNEVQTLADNKKQEIENSSALGIKEKNEIKKFIDDLVVQNNRLIDMATSNAIVEQIVAEVKTIINKVSNYSNYKLTAIKAIETAANDKLEKINASKSLTNDEKIKLESQVNSIKEKQTQFIINQCRNNADIDKAKSNAIEEIAKVDENISPSKSQAISELKKVADNAKSKLSTISPSLTIEENKQLNEAINKEYNKYLQLIKDSEWSNNVESNKELGIKTINNFVPSNSKTKIDANKKINKLIDDKINAISDNKTLTFEQKAPVINKVNQLRNDYINEINNSIKTDDIEKILAKAKVAIDNIKIESNNKPSPSEPDSVSNVNSDLIPLITLSIMMLLIITTISTTIYVSKKKK